MEPEFAHQVAGYPGDDAGITLWILVAAQNWDLDLLNSFIQHCGKLKNGQVKFALEALINRKKVKWSPY